MYIRAVKSLPGRFDSIERTNIWTRYCDAFPTSSSHRVNLRWHKRVVLSSNEPNYTRIYAFQRKSKEVSYSNDENWLIRSRDRLITRWNLGNLSISKKGIFPRERFFTRSRSIFVFTGMKNTRYRDAYTWSMPSEKRGNCVGSRANGCVISLLIAPAADLIQPRNRCLGRVLTGR